MSKKGIPVIFVHQGYSSYLDYAFHQALSYNPRSDFFILGNDDTNKFSKAHFVPVKKYHRAVLNFEKNYRHLSSNDPAIELFCFERWFYIKELMKEYNLEKIFTCDSDVMLFCNVSDEVYLLDNNLAAYCFPEDQENFRLGASAHVSFWTYEGIEKLCKLISGLYSGKNFPSEVQEKWDYVVKNNIPGGITDMVALNLFSKKFKVSNLLTINSNSTYDDNINSSENYLRNEFSMENGIKKIIWKDKIPFGLNQQGETVRFKALHFQGVAKGLMKEYFKMNQGDFRYLKIKAKRLFNGK
ncbi:MAG: hypothetical protein K2X86_11180 [Cytophagaceae bacterium]|nr:hypothetical protein [Cytophagaceae bacterium]